MSLGLAFWILMLIWLAFSLWASWPNGLKQGGGNLLLFLVICLLGWKVFGPPING